MVVWQQALGEVEPVVGSPEPVLVPVPVPVPVLGGAQRATWYIGVATVKTGSARTAKRERLGVSIFVSFCELSICVCLGFVEGTSALVDGWLALSRLYTMDEVAYAVMASE